MAAIEEKWTSSVAEGPEYRFSVDGNNTRLNMRDPTQQPVFVTIKRDSFMSDKLVGRLVLDPIAANASPDRPCVMDNWQTLLSSDGSGAGMVHLQVSWQPMLQSLPLANGRHGILTATIKRGNNLVAKDSGGRSDPYVELTVGKQGGDEKEQRTTVIKKTLNPEWNQSFRFVLENARLQGLYLMCWDDDVLGRDFMGSAVAKVGEAVHAGSIEKIHELQNSESGTLTVSTDSQHSMMH